MEFIDPYTELYEGVFTAIERTGYETYDYLPNYDAAYPFVFLGEQTSKDKHTKTRTLGTTSIIIHVFDHDDKRREMNRLLATIRKIVHDIRKTEHFSWSVTSSDTYVLYENTTNFGNKLAHGILNLTLEFE